MIDYAARARHRYHTKLTQQLAKAKRAVEHAQTAPPLAYPGLDAARLGRAKAQLERALTEIKLWESEHPDE